MHEGRKTHPRGRLWRFLTTGRLRWLVVPAAVLAVASLLTPEGCASPLRINPNDYKALRHAIFIQGDGTPADLVDSHGHPMDLAAVFQGSTPRPADSLKKEVAANRKAITKGLPAPHTPNYSYRAYLDSVFAALEAENPAPKHILLWVHGGRNPLGHSAQRTLAFINGIPDSIYPIAINWQSSDVSAYWAHLVQERPAKRTWLERAWTAFRPPLILAHDLGRGIFRTPMTMYDDFSREWTATVCAKRSALCDSSTGLVYSRGAVPEGGGKYFRALGSILTLPIRGVGMLFVNTIGPGDWEGLKHSAQAMFQTDYDLMKVDSPGPMSEGTGALHLFDDKLDDYLNRHKGAKVTVLAHSMGAIICVELLRHEPELPVDNIVFMAAACRVHELHDVIVPFMQLPGHGQTRFFNLTLHQVADLQETPMPFLGDVVYRGSLLTWIDDFLSTSESPMERTLGRDENILPVAALVPDTLRGRVTLKAFGRGDPLEARLYKRVPLRHGDFSDSTVAAWRPEFWEPDSAVLARRGGPKAAVVER